MWEVGFKNFLLEVLELFFGEISIKTNEIELVLSKKGEDMVAITLKDNGIEFKKVLAYEELYDILVPDHKMEYLYLFQDVIEGLQKPEVILKSMLPAIMEMKEDMEKPEVVELIGDIRFEINGKVYEQLAFM